MINIGVSADNVGYLFLAFLAVIPAFVVYVLLGRLAQWILRIKSGVFLALWVVLGLGGGVAAAWVAIDTIGVEVPAQVVDKTETVRLRDQGDWGHELTVNLRYAVNGQPLPRATSPEEARFDAMRPGSGQEMVAYHPDTRIYDSLKPGDEARLRILRIADLFSLTRLMPNSYVFIMPLVEVSIGVGVLILGLIAWGLRKTRSGCVLWVLLVTAAILVPLPLTYRDWQRSEDPTRETMSTTATVRDVTRITRIDPLGSSRGESTEIDAAQHYDIVQFDFIPPGYAGPVIGVDAVDMDMGSPPRFEKGATVEIAYILDDPREVKIPEATRTYLWVNLLAFYREMGLLAGFILALFILLGMGNLRRWLTSRRQ